MLVACISVLGAVVYHWTLFLVKLNSIRLRYQHGIEEDIPSGWQRVGLLSSWPPPESCMCAMPACLCAQLRSSAVLALAPSLAASLPTLLHTPSSPRVRNTPTRCQAVGNGESSTPPQTLPSRLTHTRFFSALCSSVGSAACAPQGRKMSRAIVGGLLGGGAATVYLRPDLVVDFAKDKAVQGLLNGRNYSTTAGNSREIEQLAKAVRGLGTECEVWGVECVPCSVVGPGPASLAPTPGAARAVSLTAAPLTFWYRSSSWRWM